MYKKICINGETTFNVELGRTFKEWQEKYDGGEYWNFPIEEFINGAVEPDNKMVYWLIAGRLYETDMMLM